MRRRWSWTVALLGLPVLASAHYPILTPPSWQATKGEEILVTYAFGHPFEVELAPAARPSRAVVYPPEGEPVDLIDTLRARAEAQPEAGYELRFTPQVRGDHWVVVESASDHDGVAITDQTKLPIHVSHVQQGWDRTLGLALELVPLTRPYGIPRGATFRAQALLAGQRLPGAFVSVEYKNTTPPAELPPDALITRVEKTGPGGAFAVTLDREGWWILSVEHEHARGNLWVWVGP